MATASRPRLLVPGLLPLDPTRETYRVRPGAATVVALEADDRLTIRDLSGAQRAELTVVGAGGREDYEALEMRGGGRATVLRSLVSSSADGAARVIAALAAHGLDPSAATAAELFGPSSPAGAEEMFRASRPVIVVVGAPAGDLVVDGGVPASDLQLEVSRSARRGEQEPTLPEPLADPRLDKAARWLAAIAHQHYRAADKVMTARPAGRLRAPRLMSAVYGAILSRMETAGWGAPRARVTLGRGAMLWILLRRGLVE